MCVVALTVCCASIKHLFPLEMFLVLSSQSPDKHLMRINRWGEMGGGRSTDGYGGI